jgi:glycosyltransferase involved in cell wall biosynthesis
MRPGSSPVVIVPAFNEGKVVGTTVDQLLSAGHRVVIVDDGSTDNTPEVRRLPIVYLRHAVNLGQGAALQTGMTYALRSGAAIAVHFDADRQHDCGQIETLIAPIVNQRADVVFGSRFLRREDACQVPLKRRFALRAGIVISWAMTGVLLSDTHNGLRARSRRALQMVQLQENGFAHATEIMQRVREAGLIYTEVPTTVTYSEYFQVRPKDIRLAKHSIRPDPGETDEMILAQPILVALLPALVLLYFARLRSRTSDGAVIAFCFSVAALLVIRPTLATSVANLVGIGRGVDLIFYVSIPGLALMVLLLFARTRDLNLMLTAMVRDTALTNANVGYDPDRSQK